MDLQRIMVGDAMYNVIKHPLLGAGGKVIYELAGFIAIKNPYVLGAKVFVDVTSISDWAFSKF